MVNSSRGPTPPLWLQVACTVASVLIQVALLVYLYVCVGLPHHG